ncbi:bifunctional [glutamine synthetase] adenylyltransferase/[glutamine synthetase]-adenylyl-L-tyrosine phosphorylase [Caulobacter sp. 17J80-11]|uniref:bifunctional [glutamine synthetase] adenylyltransferase/[glutamine synthetase]-adenylyl-L-tyrosine phosphorylase n=1 Tax=Caulobacter sp. 17J80-11 TaxID=2763502 RepID=UPI0016535ED2|nr:bifunctional [glutamine synthetase] adenylyltransferase/[glutamine synthetase]-adenylyl-L-tyrosine phosphorylase [Caulobacter sp. 17J80-11]MBC6980961.1 bifunctional [glutamine synthetase] adenylyltransferase/[glutamine synthetase]-adenylyl-L-tyrosine phosphorylase [Caulobacter sp. 17J80-11]
MQTSPLVDRLRPCGPVTDSAAAERVREVLADSADAAGWSDLLADAWPALAPVFGASPYLASLARRSPDRLRTILEADPDARLEELLAATDAAAGSVATPDELKHRLRVLKGDAHLLTALSDLGGVWDLDQVTGAITRFADATVRSALDGIAREARQRGRLLGEPSAEHGPIPGLFGLAMGKHGAFELNYSSDIDVSLFYDPEVLPVSEAVEPQAFVNRVAQALTNLLSERTAEGYVFRVDLRLRPDPSTTPPVVRVPAALVYYETVGQNWERAAFIKARPCVGDLPAAQAFLDELRPYVWRRSLDFAAVADIHSIKRQIHVWRADERLEAAGANLKLGAGGIREIEFFVQTQQLILGGRDPSLRSSRTLDALEALRRAGHVTTGATRDLTRAYERLRALEHRVQMLEDEQTHTLPEDAEARARVAALAGEGDLGAFDASVATTLKTVNRRYGELFAEEEQLSSRFGSLVFTGVEDDPSTLETLARMGFSNPAQVSSTIRAWHHGTIPATRTARGRELFTRLAPRLLEAAHASDAPDDAFNRFAAFFSGLSAGVQTQSLLLAQPALFGLIVEVMASAPRLASTLARRPAALDAILDQAFFAPLDEDSGVCQAIVREGSEAASFEAAMDAVRRTHREQAFRIGLQVLSGTAGAEEAGRGFADLADACVQGLARAALTETTRVGGALPGGEVAVVALGKFGSREMTAQSDLDLMTVYAAADPAAASEGKGWSADTFYGRFTQRLIAALSAPTAEGGLYAIDMQLRPSGAAGPVAVSLPAMEDYYAREADTWEHLALTRARVAWASSPAFGARVAAAIEAALRRPRDRAGAARDVADMRALMERERPARGFWDLKLSPGGTVDAEFLAQFLEIAGAGEGGPLRAGTLDALEALKAAGAADAITLDRVASGWRLHQNIDQLLKAALDERGDPDVEPAPFKRRLARAGGARDFDTLKRKLAIVRQETRGAFERILSTEMRATPVED